MTPRSVRGGQAMLEYAVLVAAAVSAVMVMAQYVNWGLQAHMDDIEQEFTGGTQERVLSESEDVAN